MAKKVIFVDTTNVGRLHCDACGYDLPEPRSWDVFASGELISFPCPKCDADMLTERDWRDAMRMFRRIEWINKWFGWMGSEQPGPDAVEVHMKSHDGHIEVRHD